MTDQNKIKELTLTRIFNAPRELVFKAWTDPKLVVRWWGPRGITNPVCELDVRPHGAIHIVMLAGEELGDLKGSKWPMKGVFQEIVEPEKIIFTSTAIINDKPILENLCTVMFEDYDGKTKITLQVVVTKATPEVEGPLSGMEMGWSQSLDKLKELLENPEEMQK